MTIVLALWMGCRPPAQVLNEFNPITLGECPAEDDDPAEFSVTGTFDYSGHGVNEATGLRFRLSGTVTFEQEEDMVRVISSEYDDLDLRSVSSDFGQLEGNMLFLTLVSTEDGETEETRYEAEVTFIFSDDGDEFCVAYTDTNGDGGDMGSFVGRRM